MRNMPCGTLKRSSTLFSSPRYGQAAPRNVPQTDSLDGRVHQEAKYQKCSPWPYAAEQEKTSHRWEAVRVAAIDWHSYARQHLKTAFHGLRLGASRFTVMGAKVETVPCERKHNDATLASGAAVPVARSGPSIGFS